jgi:hypothetical protein
MDPGALKSLANGISVHTYTIVPPFHISYLSLVFFAQKEDFKNSSTTMLARFVFVSVGHHPFLPILFS